MNQTSNYKLSQWSKDDRVLMEDFNADNAKIDAGLAALAQTAAGHGAAIAKLGNCQLYYTSYTGNGESTRGFTFPHRPMLIVCMSENMLNLAVQGVAKTVGSTRGAPDYYYPTTWSGNSVTWTETNLGASTNINGVVYHMIALMDAGG